MLGGISLEVLSDSIFGQDSPKDFATLNGRHQIREKGTEGHGDIFVYLPDQVMLEVETYFLGHFVFMCRQREPRDRGAS